MWFTFAFLKAARPEPIPELTSGHVIGSKNGCQSVFFFVVCLKRFNRDFLGVRNGLLGRIQVGAGLAESLRGRSWNWAATVISCGTYLLNSEALGVELGQQGIGDIAFVLEPMLQIFMSLDIRALRNVFFWLTSRWLVGCAATRWDEQELQLAPWRGNLGTRSFCQCNEHLILTLHDALALAPQEWGASVFRKAKSNGPKSNPIHQPWFKMEVVCKKYHSCILKSIFQRPTE